MSIEGNEIRNVLGCGSMCLLSRFFRLFGVWCFWGIGWSGACRGNGKRVVGGVGRFLRDEGVYCGSLFKLHLIYIK
jgi:hypothetical protein